MPFTQRKKTTSSKNSRLKPKECCACAVGALDRHLTIPIQGRFAIASSYRMRNQVKPRASTKNPVIRYLYAIISFPLKNVRIALLWMQFSPMKQRPRTTDMRVFRFNCFIIKIGRALQALMGMVKGIPIQQYPV